MSSRYGCGGCLRTVCCCCPDDGNGGNGGGQNPPGQVPLLDDMTEHVAVVTLGGSFLFAWTSFGIAVAGLLSIPPGEMESPLRGRLDRVTIFNNIVIPLGPAPFNLELLVDGNNMGAVVTFGPGPHNVPFPAQSVFPATAPGVPARRALRGTVPFITVASVIRVCAHWVFAV